MRSSRIQIFGKKFRRIRNPLTFPAHSAFHAVRIGAPATQRQKRRQKGSRIVTMTSIAPAGAQTPLARAQQPPPPRKTDRDGDADNNAPDVKSSGGSQAGGSQRLLSTQA
jgi:hypothetical protein